MIISSQTHYQRYPFVGCVGSPGEMECSRNNHSVPRRRTIARSAQKCMCLLRVPLFNLFEAGRGFLAYTVYPRLRSLRSLSLGLLIIKPRRGFALAEKKTIMRISHQVEEYNLRNMCYRYDLMQLYLSRRQLFFRFSLP